MPWNYDPKDAKRGLSEGEYEARLADVKDGTSKAGNAMRVITFEVYGPTGNNVRVKDYFVEGQAFAVRKMKELAGAIGRARRTSRREHSTPPTTWIRFCPSASSWTTTGGTRLTGTHRQR